VLAPVGTRELVASRGVPDNVIGEKLIQGGHVAGGERLVAPADKILIGMGQWFLLALAGSPRTIHPPAGHLARQIGWASLGLRRPHRRLPLRSAPRGRPLGGHNLSDPLPPG